jgi:competence protein ComEA
MSRLVNDLKIYKITISESAINVNNASVQELEKLPHVGEKIARRIIEHREKFGSFRRAEHLLLIDGISDGHYREMRNFVRVK